MKHGESILDCLSLLVTAWMKVQAQRLRARSAASPSRGSLWRNKHSCNQESLFWNQKWPSGSAAANKYLYKVDSEKFVKGAVIYAGDLEPELKHASVINFRKTASLIDNASTPALV